MDIKIRTLLDTLSQKNSIRIILSVVILAFLIQCKSSSSDDSSEEIVGDISPMLVGTNVWYQDPGEMAWQFTKQAGIKAYRIGGNQYNDNLPSNETLLDWVQKIERNNGVPILQLSQHGTPEVAAANAAAVVRFFNLEQNTVQPIKYWSIGNEPWLEWGRPSFSEVAPRVAEYWLPIAAAMKEVDPTIKIYGPNFSDFYDQPYFELFGGRYDITGKVPDKEYYYVDGLLFHRYPQGNGDPAVEGANDILARIIKAKAKIDEVNELHGRTGDDALIWGIGEFNSKGGPEVHTWGNGQMFGAVYGYAMEYGAKFVTSWSMFENGGSRQGTDFSLFDGANRVPRSSYWHSDFVAKYLTGSVVEAEESSSDFLVFAAEDGDQLSVMIMNRGFGADKNYKLHLKKTELSSTGTSFSVDADRDEIFEDSIEPRSTQVIIFRGENITKISYSSSDFNNQRAPTYENL